LAAFSAEKERALNRTMNKVLRPKERNKLPNWFEFFNYKRRENDSRMSLQ